MSSVFLHGGGAHLGSNLFALFRIGPAVDKYFGPARVLVLYLLSGICANVAGLYFGPRNGLSIGASGAVFGLVGSLGGYWMRNSDVRDWAEDRGESLLRNVAGTLLINLLVASLAWVLPVRAVLVLVYRYTVAVHGYDWSTGISCIGTQNTEREKHRFTNYGLDTA